ncbi:MAG: TlpA disulfide reductase family protein [Ectothiorhodospiraceae bacterium]
MVKRKDFWGVALAALVVAGAAVVWLVPWQGQKAPDVAMTTLEGETFELAELQGQPTVITFWATTCTSCVAEIPHLKDLYEEFRPQGFEIVAVAMEYDPEDQVRTMVSEKDMEYPVVLDNGGRIARAFGDIRLTPTTFVLGPDGTILQRRQGLLDVDRLSQDLETMVPGEPVAVAETIGG